MPRGRPKKKIAQQEIAAEATLKAGANPACSACRGKGWHWGFVGSRSDQAHRRLGSMMLRCLCVDEQHNKAA